MQPFDWSHGLVVTTTLAQFLVTTLHWLPVRKIVMFKTVVSAWKCLNGTAPSYFSELCVPADSASVRQHLYLRTLWRYTNAVIIIIISGQPRLAYYKFPEPEPWSAGRVSLSQDLRRGTVSLPLYGDQRWHCILSSDNRRPICSTSDVSTNRRNIHHRQVAPLWRLL